MTEDWKKLQVPLGLVASLFIGIGGIWGYLHSEYVHADDFKTAIRSIEVRGLERDKKILETEVLKLEVKKEALPEKFDPVDRAILEKHKRDLEELKQDIKDTKTRK